MKLTDFPGIFWERLMWLLSDCRFWVIMLMIATVIFITLPYGPLKNFGFVRRFCCFMGWHSHGDWDYTYFDGASQHARCKWCGFEGMLDHGGSIF
jgi:hypothetical protein